MTIISIKRYPTKYNKCSEQFVSVALTTESCVYENLESRDTDSYGILGQEVGFLNRCFSKYRHVDFGAHVLLQAVLENERQPHSMAFFSKGKIKQQKRLADYSGSIGESRRITGKVRDSVLLDDGDPLVPVFSNCIVLRALCFSVVHRKRSHYEQQNVFRQSSGAVPAFSMLRSQQLPPPLPSPSPSFHLYPFFTVSSILPQYQSIPFCSLTARFLMDTMSACLEANHLHNPDFLEVL
ncbi:hypothetical protein HZH68_000959 [Vespula germanica]|uniref:Uncharacterized protein n=1 Tax=Vespula germanica TaxID=30212 RepID=A0A834U6C9_VESGE|nr:hypothetical protein HZH68_000959 [Vespula germanica]